VRFKIPSTDLKPIRQAAEKIQQQLGNGEISEIYCMTALATPVTESWDAALQLADDLPLSPDQQRTLLSSLTPTIQKQLKTTGFDNFDLIYERLLQLVLTH